MEIKIIHSEDKILITDDNGESVTISFDEYVVNSELSLLEIKDKFYGKNKIHILCIIQDIFGGKRIRVL